MIKISSSETKPKQERVEKKAHVRMVAPDKNAFSLKIRENMDNVAKNQKSEERPFIRIVTNEKPWVFFQNSVLNAKGNIVVVLIENRFENAYYHKLKEITP